MTRPTMVGNFRDINHLLVRAAGAPSRTDKMTWGACPHASRHCNSRTPITALSRCPRIYWPKVRGEERRGFPECIPEECLGIVASMESLSSTACFAQGSFFDSPRSSRYVRTYQSGMPRCLWAWLILLRTPVCTITTPGKHEKHNLH